MGHVSYSRKAAATAALVMWAMLVFLVHSGAARAGQSSDTATEELRSLMATAMVAARQSDQTKLGEIARGLMIPNSEAWFKATFGEEQGSKMAAAYLQNSDREEKWYPKLFAMLGKQEGELVVKAARELPELMNNWCGRALVKAEKNAAEFYRVSVERVETPGVRAGMIGGYFTFLEGAYRRLDCRTLGLHPEEKWQGNPNGTSADRILLSDPSAIQPTIIRIGGNVQRAKIISRIAPVYPEEARNAQISGTVHLHVVLAKDGTVEQLEVISGHPLLIEAALDAVRQWKYQPTLLNGEPVEVDTVIDVIFALNDSPTPAKNP